MASAAQRGGANVIRGWCPTVHEPMQTGDGLLVRVKPPGGRLSSDAARRLAASARAYGNGIMELTGRGNFQVRGLTPEGVALFAAAMVETGLASADAGAERRRNVLVSPLSGDDPHVADETDALSASIEAMLVDGIGLGRLPPKFCIAVDGGGVLPLAFSAADIIVRLDPLTVMVGEGRLSTAAFGRGEGVDGRPSPTTAIEATTALLRQLAADAGDRRMHDPVRVPLRPVEPVGFHQYASAPHGAFGLGLPFGETDAATLTALAGLAERFSDGILRVSPWRTLLLGSVRTGDAGRVAEEATALGLIADPRDPRLRVFACIGSAGCASGSVPARADAARLAATEFEGTLHVSGCAKGCAHPSPATVTMVGEAGRYHVVHNDRASAA